MGRVGDDAVAVLDVRGEHAVVSGEMGAGARHEGGESGDEIDGVEQDMSGPVTEGVLESIHDLPAIIDREAFRSRALDGRCSGKGVRGSRAHGIGSAYRHGGRIPRAERCRGWTLAGGR